ncbi:MAG: hydrogenase maturation protease [Nitriliruptoraceae bacterium]
MERAQLDPDALGVVAPALAERDDAVPPATPGGQLMPVLVLGIGSLIRTDDAVGRLVADRLAEHPPAGVEVDSVHQLTPEFAPRLAGRDLVVFVDAAVDPDVDPAVAAAEVTVVELAIDGSGRLLSHHLGPAGLLTLAAQLGWAPARAAAIHIPVTDLALGTEISAEAAGRVEEAFAMLLRLVS